MFKRLLQIDINRKKSFFLFGPRGTGKTSWVTNYFPEAIYIDLLKTSDYTTLQADPSRLEKMVLSNKDNDWVIIDEVQKVPQLLDEASFNRKT